MKIIIETGLKKIPNSCMKCEYFISLFTIPEFSSKNDGHCTALSRGNDTRNIVVSKERLKNCPLREVE